MNLLSDSVRYDFLAADETRLPSEGFAFHVDSSLTRDPYRVYFVIDINDGVFFERTKSVVVGVGDSIGIADNFESGPGEWTHEGEVNVDDWHLSTRRAFSGSSSWHCGKADTSAYSENQDAFLRTPFFISGASSRLIFHQWLDVENENSHLAWDGCLVEASRDNINWEQISPVGGYPYTIDLKTGSPGAGLGCFSGKIRRWEQAEFDLSKYTGALWIRFRMITDGGSSGEGWYVDDVRVTTEKTAYDIAFSGASASPGRVEIRWQVDPQLSIYNGQGITLYRDHNTREPVYSDPSRSSGVHSFVDTNVVSGEYYSYLIEDITASGGVNWIVGPTVYVPFSTHTLRIVSCSPNPYVAGEGNLVVTFEIPEGLEGPIAKHTKVAVFDPAGRFVALLYQDRALSGSHAITWNGVDSEGRTVASGVYIISLETSGTRFSRKIVLLR